MELLLACASWLAALAVLGVRRSRASAALAGLTALVGLAGWWTWQPGGDPSLAAALPGEVRDGGFATSSACRACHPGPYDAWHRSYHRTMTQPATPEAVLATYRDATLEARGHAVRVERRGDEFWADLPDPLWFTDPSPDRPAEPPRIRVRVIMTTGSHHLQNYWIRRPSEGAVYRNSPDNGALVQLPWTWLVAERRWVPTQDSFLSPPTREIEAPLLWNMSCNLCHSVATEPRFAGERFDTRSAELGIACEACHGPGADHVRANRSPLRRYRLRFAGDGDPTIVNPARLDQRRSSEVCGQCHSYARILDEDRWKTLGVAYRAGDELARTRQPIRYDEHPQDPWLREMLALEPDALTGRFWPDGTIRVAGREYNGLLESRCFQRGDLTCLSCHSMHAYANPSDQLAPDRLDDRACLGCHAGYEGRVAEHSHHPGASAGSRCMNCHMPHTTYGLFVAMRSHRIDSPSAALTARTGRPNACNLCHLDRTLGWTSRHLSEWYGQAPADLSAEQRSLSAAVLAAVQGDAAQRAIVAWHMGWAPAHEASGRGWLAPYLALLLADPYVAVRRVAGRSIATLPGFRDLAFDYLAPEDEIGERSREAMARWQRLSGQRQDRLGAHLLQERAGRLDEAELRRLLARRDHTPVRIIE